MAVKPKNIISPVSWFWFPPCTTVVTYVDVTTLVCVVEIVTGKVVVLTIVVATPPLVVVIVVTIVVVSTLLETLVDVLTAVVV